TTTASYVWRIVMRPRAGSAVDPHRAGPPARVEREHHDRTERERQHSRGREEPVGGDPDPRAPDVVQADHAQPVDPVDQREREHQPVPRSPEGALPAHRHEPEVHSVHALSEHVHDQHVSHGQDEQQDPGYAHEHPPPELAGFGRPPPSRTAAGPAVETTPTWNDRGGAPGLDRQQKYFTKMGFTMR